jgi:predicted Zn-dependent peptidase
MRKQPGPFVARAEIIAASTDSALVEFLKELNGIRDTIPVDELEKAKQYMQLQLPNAFEATADIAAQLVPVALYDLPLDYYNNYAQSVNAVSQSDAARVSNSYIKPESMVVVMVGDRSVVEPLLRQMGIRYQVRNVIVK